MASYFETKLLELLPALYRQDESGDLSVFLRLIAPTLDGLKDDLDRFPSIVNVDGCDEKYLALLARLLGRDYDGRDGILRQRRLIKETVPYYRRKSTPAAIVRDLESLGWRGRFVEGFPRTMRLGISSRLNSSRPAGRLYNDGTAVIHCDNYVDIYAVRRALKFHQPAGTRFFLLGKIAVIEAAAPGMRAWGRRSITTYVPIAIEIAHRELDQVRYRTEPFRLGHSFIGRYDRLTFSSISMTEGYPLWQQA